MITKRRRRNDTTHYVYVITNQATGQQYVGVTVKNPGGVYKTLRRRIQKHVQRALSEAKGWELCESIRTWGPENFTFGLLDTVRGRKAAHSVETAYINNFRPALNTFCSK